MKKHNMIITLVLFCIITVVLVIGITASESSVVWLDELEPVDALTVEDNRYGVNSTLTWPDKPVKVGGNEYAHGVSFHPLPDSPAHLVYNIEGMGFKTFYAIVGKDAAAGAAVGGDSGIKGTTIGSEVWIDGVKIAESGALKYPETYEYKLDVTGAKELKIVITDGGDTIYCDTSSWANACLSADAFDSFVLPAEAAAVTPEPTEEPTPPRTNPPDIDTLDEIQISNMEWIAAEIYSGANDGVPARDENIAQEELWIADEYFEKGVCFHAKPGGNSFLEISLDGRDFKSFAAYAGTAISGKYDVSMATVEFIFYLDGSEVYRTGLLTSEDLKQVFFSIEGGKVLRIELTDGEDGISGDWGALGDAKLLKTVSKEEAFATPEPTPTKAPTTEKSVTETINPSNSSSVSTAKPAIGVKPTPEPTTDNKKSAMPWIIAGLAVVAASVAAVIIVIKTKKKK